MRIFEEKLKSYGIFSNKIPSKLENIINSINTNLTKEMKLQLLCHYLTFLISQFRIPILFNNQLIPINSICFLFSYSGSGKDTTINLLRNVIEPSMNLIEERQQELNITRAENFLQYYGKGSLEDYLLKLPPNEIGISTPEGLVQSLENLNQISLGSLNINTNEFISEVNNSSLNLFGMMNILAELYDIGKKNSKQLKDKSKENKSLNNIFINGLFTSSFNLTLDSSIRKKIIQEFQSRFARRSSITFNNISNTLENIENIEKWLNEQLEIKSKNNHILYSASEHLKKNVVVPLLEHSPKFIKISEEALKIIILYQEYCKRYSKIFETPECSFSYLNIVGKYWQALKLSGTLCLIQYKFEIEKEHIIDAINIIEIINQDIFKFEKELSKMSYEILVDYCNNLHIDEINKISIPIHFLKKIHLINDIKKLDELLLLCNSEDRKGIYSYNEKEKNLEYSRMQDNNTYIISCRKVETENKEILVKNLYKPLIPYNVPKEKLVNMLKTSLIYSPYHYKQNIRNKENLILTTNLLVFDIDNSEYSYEEFHKIIKGNLNHLIATTSNKENKFKFRILIPLKYKVIIEEKLYIKLLKKVAKNYLLDIKFDKLPQCQAYFSYNNSNVLYQFNSEYLNIKEYLLELLNDTISKDISEYSEKEKKTLLKNKFVTFKFAYDSELGNRHKNLILVINNAYDLGATYQETLNLLKEINDFIDYPLTLEDFNKTLLPHLRKKYGTI